MSGQLHEATLTGTGSSPILDPSENDAGISISGTFVATITIQRSLDDEASWHALSPTYTAPAEINVIPNDGALYKAEVTAFTSGSVVLQLRG